MRKIWTGFSVFLATVGILLAQTYIQRPTNTQTGYTEGVTVISGAAPTTGYNSELILCTNCGSDNGPRVYIWDGINANADIVSVGAGFPFPSVDDQIVDTAGDAWANAGSIVWEGATANLIETFLTAEDQATGDATFHLPNNNAAADNYNIMFSVLDTNALQVANSIWFDTNMMIFEGVTPDAFETRLVAEDADTGIHTFQLPDNNAAADTYNLMFSLLDTNALQVANSIWFDANMMVFEGAGVDAFETQLLATDPTVGVGSFYLPDNAAAAANYALVFSTLATNALDAANSVWFAANGVTYEGANVDAFEVIVSAEEPTVGDDTYLFMDRALAADNYEVLGVPDGTWTTGNLYWGEYTDAVAAFANADNVMVVQRVYIPHTVTVTHVDLINIDIANVSAADNTIAVAIYHDADAGVQIVEQVGVTDDGAGNTSGLYTIDITDTTLHPGWYRIGFCAQDASDNDIEGHTANADYLLMTGGGAATGELYSEGTACTAGDPAATTGALTAAAHIPVFKLRTQ